MYSPVERFLLELNSEELEQTDWSVIAEREDISLKFILDHPFPWNPANVVRSKYPPAEAIRKHLDMFRHDDAIIQMCTYIPIEELRELLPELGVPWEFAISHAHYMGLICINPGITLDFIKRYSNQITDTLSWSAINLVYSNPIELCREFPDMIQLTYLVRNEDLTDELLLEILPVIPDGTEVSCINLSMDLMLKHPLRYFDCENRPDYSFTLSRLLGQDITDSSVAHQNIRQLDVLIQSIDLVEHGKFGLAFNPNITPEFIELNQLDVYPEAIVLSAQFDAYLLWPNIYKKELFGLHPEAPYEFLLEIRKELQLTTTF